jgi:curli biogenesis system outer membrane secretion channel CsgG
MKKMYAYAVVSALAAASLTGCASVATSDTITQRTAFTLGIPKESFTISDRMDEGFTSRYTVKTDAGAQYNCYVASYFSLGTGHGVSDAVCNQAVGSSTAATQPCDALSKAAGQCR